MAGQNLLLAAHAQGLGACWMCAPLFAPEVARQVLDLPADWGPQGLVVLGWPDEAPAERGRMPLERVTLYR
jgi:nitroreductase